MEENVNPARNIAYELYPPALRHADKNLRLANYVIDMVVFYCLILLYGIIIGLIVTATGGDTRFFYELENMNPILDRILTMIMYGCYMGVTEGMFYGKSLGKLITKTKAVKLDGSDITFSTALKRGFCRIIPFEVLSALGTSPWHDSLTDTMVVTENQLKEFRERTLVSSPGLNT